MEINDAARPADTGWMASADFSEEGIRNVCLKDVVFGNLSTESPGEALMAIFLPLLRVQSRIDIFFGDISLPSVFIRSKTGMLLTKSDKASLQTSEGSTKLADPRHGFNSPNANPRRRCNFPQTARSRMVNRVIHGISNMTPPPP